MSIKVLNIDSTGKSENLNLSEKLIGLKVNNKLLKYVVDWQLNRSKKRVAKTKQRNEVTGSTRKIYAQNISQDVKKEKKPGNKKPAEKKPVKQEQPKKK